jgi:hypothetical protein
MATTTNYGWTTPDDTALVKDGASAIRTLGSSVDTTTKALNPSTTLGDIEYRSSTANTNTRLGIGTTGQVLSVSGGVPAWATVSSGGLTLLSTTSLTGATTTISSIDQTYVNLFAIISGVTNATSNGNFRLAPNGVTNIVWVQQMMDSTLTSRANTYLNLSDPGNTLGSGNNENIFTFTINDYASSSKYKTVNLLNGYNDTGNSQRGGGASGYVRTTSAITSLVFSNSAGNLSTGTVLLYGVK